MLMTVMEASPFLTTLRLRGGRLVSKLRRKPLFSTIGTVDAQQCTSTWFHATEGRSSNLSVTGPPFHSSKQPPKRDYRVFLLGHNSRITGSQDLEADSDESAVTAALNLNLPCDCEVWERARLVAELPARR